MNYVRFQRKGVTLVIHFCTSFVCRKLVTVKLIKEYFVLIIFIVGAVHSNAQVQSLFNDKVELKSMASRWELDSTSARGTFLVTPYKSIYILPFVWSNVYLTFIS